ncbi:integrase core domain-containing protein, partial [Nocardia vulneris]|uniref:integrase core domain-containing protein n=1 Tax=Nocardia vulneris TaxID=1141657 RepID=UPI0012DFF9A2
MLPRRGLRDRLSRLRSVAAACPHSCAFPQTNGVIERFSGTLKYEPLHRGVIADGDTLDMKVHRFRVIYNTLRPHQAPGDRTPEIAYPRR